MTETAFEHEMRNIRPLLKEIAGLRNRPEQKSPHELAPGEYVKIGDEWVRFVGIDPDGGMRVYRIDSACEWTYPPTLGELFVWHEGAF